MGNQHFHFKQFTIHQDRCAMKVTTDACVFGALLGQLTQDRTLLHALDIGTGTGLLSLMFAQQRAEVKIDAVELDAAAAGQARENVMASPFADRIKVTQADIKAFRADQQYEVIFSNPPFYEQQLQSGVDEKNMAHHSSHLLVNEVLKISKGLLRPNGQLLLLLPAYRKVEVKALATATGYHCDHMVWLRQSPKHDRFRVVLRLSLSAKDVLQETEIIIRDETGNYSPEMTELMHPFYLRL